MPGFPTSQEEYLTELNEAQREAVLHVEGPLLVLAGPGSGKTRVITRRIAHLLNQGIRPYQILAITFTNKAAGEMRQRVETMLPNSRVFISTFHSFGVRFLKQYADRLNIDPNFTIYDQSDRVRMVKNALEACRIDNARFTPETIQGAISRAKNQLLRPAAFAQTAKDFFSLTVATVYEAYEKRMRDANALDFDDLLLWPAFALKENDELRRDLDSRFQFVLVDEYQDTNKAQYGIARGLSVDYPNLCVVGDPDQSIYKWRGSDIRNILDFERDFPNARVITLDRNYRSSKLILLAADALIANNKERKPKHLFTDNGQGEPVRILHYETALEEAEGVARRIKEAVKSGKRRFRDFAVFMRVNALSRNLENAFIREQITYQMVRGLAFFERKENRDILAYLRLIINPRDDLSFLRAVNEPARGIGKTSLDHLRRYAEPRELSLLQASVEVGKIPEIKGKAVNGLRNFAKMIHELRQQLEQPAHELIKMVLERSGYQHMLEHSADPDDAERLANVEELITAAHQFVEEDNSRTLADFLENITLASDVDGWDETQDCVSIMTLHSSKGLEFPVVFMLAVEQGLLPHERSLARTDEVEEERRLAFVGMTRAMDELYLTYCRMREYRGQFNYAVPSMFLDELPAEVENIDHAAQRGGISKSFDVWRSGNRPQAGKWFDAGTSPSFSLEKSDKEKSTAEVDYEEGMAVEHEQYGLGRITEVSGNGAMRKIRIIFQKGGERTFVASKAKLKVLEAE